MAVIVREDKSIAGKTYKVEVYKTVTGKLLTDNDKKKAENLDRFLAEQIGAIEHEMEETSLLKLRGKRGKVLRLWYEVGKRLSFVLDTSIVAAEDVEFVWRAIYDHTKKLAPGPLSERVKRDPTTSHFSYCFKLAAFPFEFVEKAGDWTSWSELFDRKETKNDSRIIEWLALKANESDFGSRQDWLRPLTKEIHSRYNNIDTTIRYEEKAQLFHALDNMFLDIQKRVQAD